MESNNKEKVFNYQIMDSAPDPFVTYHNGFYYMVFTQVTHIDIYKSTDLGDISNGEITRVFTPQGENYHISKNIWAPELHQTNGKWYLYFAADDGVDENHRMYVLENDSLDPMTDN